MLKVHHIGYLVKNIERARDSFAVLGFSAKQDILYDPIREIDILFMEKEKYIVELVTPKAETSVVSKLIKTYKNTPYHMCYLSDDFEHDLSNLTASGFIQIDTPTPAPALGGRRVCFLMGSQIGLLELLEKECCK